MNDDELIKIFRDLLLTELDGQEKKSLVDMCAKFVVATTDFENPEERQRVAALCAAYLKKKGAQVKGDKLTLPESPIEEEPKMNCFDSLYDHLDNVSVKHPNLELVELDQTATLVDLLKAHLFINQVPNLAVQSNRMFLSWGRDETFTDESGETLTTGYDLVTWFEDNHLFFEVSSDAEIIDAGDFHLKGGVVTDKIAHELSVLVDNVTCEFE